MPEMSHRQQPQCLVQNINIQSVRDIIQRRQYQQSNYGPQLPQKQVNGSSLASTQNSNQFTQLSSQANRHQIRLSNGNTLPQNIQNKMIQETRQINFAHPKVRFINNFQPPIHQHNVATVFQASIQINHHQKGNFINDFPVHRDKANIVIEQQAKIDILPSKTYQKVHIFSSTSPKYWQRNDKTLKTQQNHIHSQPRPIINLRPSTNLGEIRAGFIKLQPQRLQKSPIQPNLLRQGFCA